MDGFLLDVRSAWQAAWRRPAVTVLVVASGVVARRLPARRASTVEPMEALRSE